MAEIMKDAAQITENQYKQGLQHQKDMSFTTNWPEYERFKIGNQWPMATEKTRNLPRPVFNVIKFIINHKVASVTNENLKLTFTPEEVPEDKENVMDDGLNLALEGADRFSKYSETTWEDIEQDELNEEALTDAATTGTGIWHYFWDDDVEGGITTKYKGIMKGESLDPINIFFGNPQIRKVQPQPWIIVSSRDSVRKVKEIAKANKVPVEKIELIQPDKNTNDEGYDSAQKELKDSDKVTVLIKYWKENGRVFYHKVASGVEFVPKTDLGKDTPNGFRLYPIEVMNWDLRKKSIFGVSEVEGLIPNQKAINFLIAMMLLSVQDTAWPKIYARMDALQQTITNTPGEIIYDHLNNGMDNIKYMQGGTFSNAAPVLTDKIVELTRIFTGANEAATGDPFTKDLNAAAIIAMQNAAKIPVEQIRKRFYRSIKNIGRIWEEFWKVKYNTERIVTVRDDDGNDVPMPFKGDEYADVPMKLKVDVGPGSSYSESLMVSTLDRFLDAGHIPFNIALEFYPKNVVPYKEKLKKKLDEMQSQQLTPDQILAQLSPEEQQQYMQLPPEEQQQMMQQLMAEMQQPMQQPMMG